LAAVIGTAPFSRDSRPPRSPPRSDRVGHALTKRRGRDRAKERFAVTKSRHRISTSFTSLRIATLVAILLATVATVAGTPAPVRAQGAVTTSDLNLRTGPGLDWRIIDVMPEGASVEILGGRENGFYRVSFGGTEGYAFGDYLDLGGSSNGPTGSAVTTSALNLRAGPSTTDWVILVMPEGAALTLTGSSRNGFHSVSYGGNEGWAYADYIGEPGSGNGGGETGTAYTTSDLNLRSGAGTSYGVITVMPLGASVELTGSNANGFRSVTYNGMTGWAYGDYLTTEPVSSGDSIIDIIYAAADRYGQPREDMLRVARCESVLDPNAFNPISSASGLFQFLPGTWATTPYAEYSIFDPWANANAAGWMWSVGRRNEWACQ
jgi:uncharacterized protein YraI